MNGKKKQKFKSKPFHYRSSDGFDIYVGKNNFQNDELTFKVANGNDWWFHAKGMPGSHAVSYTHLDVYKRQYCISARCMAFSCGLVATYTGSMVRGSKPV